MILCVSKIYLNLVSLDFVDWFMIWYCNWVVSIIIYACIFDVNIKFYIDRGNAMTCRIEKVDIANIFIYNIQKGVTTMAQTNINIRIDEDLKNQFEAFCSDIGMTMTTAFCVFAKAAVRKQKIPFEISTDPFYSESNMAHLRRGIEALNAGKWVEHELIEAGE